MKHIQFLAGLEWFRLVSFVDSLASRSSFWLWLKSSRLIWLVLVAFEFFAELMQLVLTRIARLIRVVVVAFAVFGAVWEWHSVLQQLRRWGSGGALGGGLSVTGFFGNPRIQFDPGYTPASKSSFSWRHSCTPSYKESLREFVKSCGVLRS